MDGQEPLSTRFNEVENLNLDLEQRNKKENETGGGDGDGDGQSAQVVNPLLMEDILDFVFICLDMKSLKTARQVNKLWKELAMRRMFDLRVLFRVRPEFYKQSKEEQEAELHGLKVPGSTGSLLSRISKLKTVRLFEERDVQVLRSLGVLGSNVTELKLLFSEFQPKYTELLKSENDLCSLTHLTNADPSDTRIHPEFMTPILGLKRPLILSGLTFGPCDHDNEQSFHILKQVSVGVVKLRRFQCDASLLISRPLQLESPPISKILRQLLDNNRDTLEEIRLDFTARIHPDFTFPVISSVTKFVCHIVPYRKNRRRRSFALSFEYGFDVNEPDFRQRGFLITSNFRFIQHLPNLSRVEFYCVAYGSKIEPKLCDLWTKSFGRAGIAPSVKTVQCHIDRNIQTEIFSTIFPNAKITTTYSAKT